MNQNFIRKSIVFIILSSSMIACSGKKPASQTSFELSGLSAMVGDASSIPGGLVLMGSNGTDRFSVGLSPSQISTFNVDLPAGNWSFSAIAWLGGSPMTGATQCGSSATKIEGSSVRVSLALNVANCQLPEFASASAFSMGTPTEFKTLTINSCLNPIGKAVNTPCDGSDLANLSNIPGENLSFRVQVSSGSTFGASFAPLTSGCYNITSLPASLNSGEVHTNLTLPYGGTNSFPLRILAYEEPNCGADDLSAIYPIIGGIHGNQGTYRTTALAYTDILYVNIADNYVGVLGSPFLSAHLTNDLVLPFPTCGNNCFNSAISEQGPTLWHGIRDAAWDLFGSPDRRSPYDFEENIVIPSSQNFTTDQGSGFSITTLPDRPEGYEVFITHSASMDPPVVSCTGATYPSQGTINIQYESTTVLVEDIVDALNADCSNMVMAIVMTPGLTGNFDPLPMLTPSVTAGAYQARRRHEGSLNSAAYTLAGPIGAILYKNGLTTFTDICTQNISFQESFPTGELITIQLSTPTVNAELPSFPTAGAPGPFERKILLSFDNKAEEAIYFNCAAGNKGVGAIVKRESEDGEVHISQIQWDTSVSEQWVEEVSYYENPLEGESWREYHLANFASGIINLWTLSGRSLVDHYQKMAAQISTGTDVVYLQDSTLLATSDPLFIADSIEDSSYMISTGVSNGYVTRVTDDPGYAGPLMPALDLDSFFAEDSTNPVGVWLLSY